MLAQSKGLKRKYIQVSIPPESNIQFRFSAWIFYISRMKYVTGVWKGGGGTPQTGRQDWHRHNYNEAKGPIFSNTTENNQ